MSRQKKSAYRVISESMVSGKFDEIELPTNSLKYRQLDHDELKEMVLREFEDAKKVSDVKYKEGHFGKDFEIANEIENWMKTLSIEECFKI